METVPDDILVLVLCHLDLEDVLACSRVSHRFHELTGRDQIWSKLCDDFRCEPAVQAEDVPALWSQVFKDSFSKQRRSSWLQRQARLTQLRSEAQEFELLTHKRKRSLHNHLRKAKSLQHELEALQRKRVVHTSLTCWQPTAVRHHHLQLLTGSRTETTWALRDVEQRLKDTQMVVSGLRQALQGSNQQLHGMRQRLLVMEGR